MGCTQGYTHEHEGFNFYNMPSGAPVAATTAKTTTPVAATTATTTMAAVPGVPYELNATNTKCAFRHPDRLFRHEDMDAHKCFTECSNTANCNYFSIALEGQYAGVCMGCMEGVTQPHEGFKFYSMPTFEAPPEQPDHCEDMPYEQRVDCGWWGVTPEACQLKGCCWR
eukprot:1408031-Amphidinium_carterae.1